MLSKFFYTQWRFPAKKKEWTNQVRMDMEEPGLRSEDLVWIKKKSKPVFKNLVKKQASELALL